MAKKRTKKKRTVRRKTTKRRTRRKTKTVRHRRVYRRAPSYRRRPRRRGGALSAMDQALYNSLVPKIRAFSKTLLPLPHYLDAANYAWQPASYLMVQMQNQAGYGDQVELPPAVAADISKAFLWERQGEAKAGAGLSPDERLAMSPEQIVDTTLSEIAHATGNSPEEGQYASQIRAQSQNRLQGDVTSWYRNAQMDKEVEEAKKRARMGFWDGFKDGLIGTLTQIIPTAMGFIPELKPFASVVSQLMPAQSTGVAGIDTALGVGTMLAG